MLDWPPSLAKEIAENGTRMQASMLKMRHGEACTVYECMSAHGESGIPPAFLMAGKYLYQSWFEGAPPGTAMSAITRGNTDGQHGMIRRWIEDWFIKYTPDKASPLGRRLLLLVSVFMRYDSCFSTYRELYKRVNRSDDTSSALT